MVVCAHVCADLFCPFVGTDWAADFVGAHRISLFRPTKGVGLRRCKPLARHDQAASFVSIMGCVFSVDAKRAQMACRLRLAHYGYSCSGHSNFLQRFDLCAVFATDAERRSPSPTRLGDAESGYYFGRIPVASRRLDSLATLGRRRPVVYWVLAETQNYL